jgi:topoisomerase-4 subunit A
VLIRKSKYRLDKIMARLEILSGYLIAYLNLDEVIRIIREEDDAKASLIKKFKLTDNQAEAILNMKLRNLRKLEEEEIRAEYDELTAEKEEIEKLLGDETLRLNRLSEEINLIKEKFGKKTALGKRRSQFADMPEDVDIPIDVIVEKEPITVILSNKGWIRSMKGYVPLTDDFKFKEDDSLQCAIHAYTTDKIVLFDTAGKFFNINASDIPSGRGFGQPVRLLADLGVNDNVCAMFVFEKGAQYLVSTDYGYGFVIDESHIFAQTRNGRKILNLAEGETAMFCKKITGDKVAIVGENRKLLVFKLEEVPSMARGHGVRLQKYQGNGKVSDIQIFKAEEGFQYNRSGGVAVEKELLAWLGHRAQVGRLVPFGFPKSSKFFKG